MNDIKNMINETGKYALLAAIFCIFAFLIFSEMATADENITATETTVITTDSTIENIVPTTISEVLPDTSTTMNVPDSVNEIISDEIPKSETTTTTETAPEETTSTLPVETETTLDELKQPLIEASLSSAKVVRGSTVSIQASLKNVGNATANITGIEFEMPEGFSIFSASYESCKKIESGNDCSFPIELSTSASTALGRGKIRVLVKYE